MVAAAQANAKELGLANVEFQSGSVIRLQRRPVFQKEISIAFFLSGNW